MPLDPSIILGYKQPEIENPLNALGKIMAVKNAQQQGELGALQLREGQRTAEDTRQTAEAYKTALNPDGTINRNNLYTNLATRGLGAKLPAVQKGFADQDKSALDAEKTKLEVGITKANVGAQILSSAKDQASYDAARAEAQARGLDVSRMPPQFDPAFIQAKLNETLSFKDQLEQKWKAMEYTTPKADALLSSQTATRGQDLSASTARRGQDMVDARSRETTAASVSKPFEITGEDGKPVLVQQDKQGNIKPVEGYGPKQGASKPLNDTQAKALQFGSRMQAAEDIFGQLAEKGVTTSLPGARSGYGVGATLNAMQPAERQQLDQAKRDFINAVLRRESGAAISPSEFDSAEKQYFPQVGETDPKIVEQKRNNRMLATRGILAEVPGSEERVAKVRQAAPQSGPKAGVVQDGYRFKGGNPADKANWEKV